jgi:hypothetical protein
MTPTNEPRPDGAKTETPPRDEGVIQKDERLRRHDGIVTAPRPPAARGLFSALSPTSLVVAAVLLAVMVFGVTWAVTVMGGSGGGRDSQQTPAAGGDALTFREKETVFPSAPKPGEKQRAAVSEVGEENTHDFWFKNELDRVVEVGMLSKTCKCTNVQVWLAPDRYSKTPREGEEEAAAAKALKDVEQVVPTDLLQKDSSAVVPPGRVGFVRLTWRGKTEGGQPLVAELWMGQKNAGSTARLQINALFVPPVWVKPLPPALELGAHDMDLTREGLTSADLGENGKTYYLLCWSATRPEFRLNSQVVHSRLEDKKNPFMVGAPEPLTPELLARLVDKFLDEQKEHKYTDIPPVVRPLSGYRIPITLRAHAEEDGTPFDLGRFKQWVELTSDALSDVIDVKVIGAITGDVTSPGSDGVVQFGTFRRNREQRQALKLETGEDVTGLELDPKRTPDFLDVELPTKAVKTGGRKLWEAVVKVRENKVSGEFPSDANARMRDSAVYIQTVGPNPACIRIPVSGTANETDEP